VIPAKTNIYKDYRLDSDGAASFLSGLITNIHSSAQLEYAHPNQNCKRNVSAVNGHGGRGGGRLDVEVEVTLIVAAVDVVVGLTKAVVKANIKEAEEGVSLYMVLTLHINKKIILLYYIPTPLLRLYFMPFNPHPCDDPNHGKTVGPVDMVVLVNSTVIQIHVHP